MKPATKTLLEARIRDQYRRAQNEDEQACDEEMRAHGRRVLANECREVAAELQALLDGKADDVMHVAVSGKVETNDIVREVQHVDTDEPEAEGIPPHVWLYRNMLTDLQAIAPLGRDETNGQYAVAIDDLTDEQRAIPHVKQQIDRIARDAKEARRPPVPYIHSWLLVRQRDAPRYAGLDLVYDQGDVAMPWEVLTEYEQRGVRPIPAALPENNT